MRRKRDFFTTSSYDERISDRRRHVKADRAPVALLERARTILSKLDISKLESVIGGPHRQCYDIVACCACACNLDENIGERGVLASLVDLADRVCIVASSETVRLLCAFATDLGFHVKSLSKACVTNSIGSAETGCDTSLFIAASRAAGPSSSTCFEFRLPTTLPAMQGDGGRSES